MMMEKDNDKKSELAKMAGVKAKIVDYSPPYPAKEKIGEHISKSRVNVKDKMFGGLL